MNVPFTFSPSSALKALNLSLKVAILNVRNQIGYNVGKNSGNQARNRNVVAARAKGNGDRNNANEIRRYNCQGIAQKEEARIQLDPEEFDFMAAVDGSTEVHQDEKCYANDIFNMFTQEEQYTDLLKPITEPHQVQQNDINVISVNSSVEEVGEQ
nr:hypothetical protein [Tanacetum cinerariifolium]